MEDTSKISLSFLKRCENITIAFQAKNEKWSMDYQFLHMYEEVRETVKAFQSGDMEDYKEECCDVILTALTALHMMDVTPREIQEAMNEKLDIVEHRCGIKDF